MRNLTKTIQVRADVTTCTRSDSAGSRSGSVRLRVRGVSNVIRPTLDYLAACFPELCLESVAVERGASYGVQSVSVAKFGVLVLEGSSAANTADMAEWIEREVAKCNRAYRSNLNAYQPSW